MKRVITKFINLFLYVFFPKICFYCNHPIDYHSEIPLCKSCINQIKHIQGLVCQKCGLPLYSGGAHCYNCKKQERKLYFSFIRGVVEYKEPIKTLIHEYKYNQKIFLKNWLALVLTEWFQKNYNIFQRIDIVCCVPMNPIKKLLRGYNQAELIAYEFSKNCNLVFKNDLLKRTKFTVSQFKLPREKRLQNVKDAFAINKKYINEIKGKNILIIDDVCTTAETINQCAKVLKKHSAKEVYGLVAARDV